MYIAIHKPTGKRHPFGHAIVESVKVFDDDNDAEILSEDPEWTVFIVSPGETYIDLMVPGDGKVATHKDKTLILLREEDIVAGHNEGRLEVQTLDINIAV